MAPVRRRRPNALMLAEALLAQFIAIREGTSAADERAREAVIRVTAIRDTLRAIDNQARVSSRDEQRR